MEMERIIRECAFDVFRGEELRFDASAAAERAVVAPQELTVRVAAGVAARLSLLHAAAERSQVRVELGAGASLALTQLFGTGASASLHAVQAAGSRCTAGMVLLAEGAAEYRFELNAPDAECALDGVFVAGDAEHCEVGVRVEHNAADCRSHSLVKGVAGGTATGAFRGLVYVAQDAQRTDARQQSRNLLLGREARIATRPQLEIYADDVKCTHGATVGQLDDDAVLYMRQRGLSEAQARALQVEGFVGDVVSRIPSEPLRALLAEAVSRKLERM
ncbi:SufD family Fe-S cluster assembly protein [uncultured Alistipes sp.]|jgi:Fe-S cluster assembly protein SufD|uniref:SufD family Fe-S cluster assembly protein n=1 Tax=uncultured Alistipes sp. TaxID=538949 RepID=UPI00260C223B|nr:SufD family Fe-S cluster assembly protein [uncultured Alistipes sp.]